MCPISAFASTAYFQVGFNQPQLQGNDFYIEVLLYNSSTSDYRVKVFYCVSSLVYTATDSVFNTGHLNIRLDLNSNGIEAFTVDSGSEIFQLSVAEFLDDNSVSYYTFTTSGEGNSKIFGLVHTDYGSGYNAVSYRVYGDVAQVNKNYTDSNNDFTIVYSQTNSVNQSILQLINAISVVAQINQSIDNKLDSVISSLNDVKGELHSIYYQLIGLFSICEDIYNKIDNYEKYIDDIEDYLGSIDNNMFNIYTQLMYIYMDTQEMISILNRCDNKLQQIIDLLNTGADEPTLAKPNDSVDSAFGDVNNMFDDVGNIGNQLDSNREQNQANMANAKSFISGFFGVVPTPIIIALAFVAICILIVKVIGR